MTTPERKIKALELFDTLVELTAAERESHLLALAQSDPELAQEVQRLLAADAAESGMLDHGVHAVARTVLDNLNVEKSLAEGLQAGSVIGGFTLLRPLGEGGMGEVWLAERRQPQAQGDFVQHVALKLLKRGMDSEALVRRFVQERRILAELNHPHIARFIDGGISADGRLYYAMEFVEGVSMLQYARQNKLGVRDCVQLMSEVCDAVAHAQAHLVVHRDLKPSNILVDKNAQPRVLDFGIAKLLDSSDPHQTASEVRAMTPIYAAPEQILGEPISTATDVYALGVILYQLLTGTLPHQRSGALIALADAVRQETVERPSSALRRSTAKTSETVTGIDQTRAAREIAGDLDTVLLMALRQEPARRYANAAAFGSDLRAWLAGMPVAAQVDTRGYRMRNFVKRNRAFVAGASAVFLALLMGLSVAIWQAGLARKQAAIAQSERERAEAANLESSTTKKFIVSRLRESEATSNQRGANLTMKEWVMASVPLIETELAQSPKAQIEIGTVFGSLLKELDAPNEAMATLNDALERARAGIETTGPMLLAKALQARGSLFFSMAELEKSRRDLNEALSVMAPLPASAEVRLLLIQTRTTLLVNANSSGKHREALALGRANLQDRIALLGEANTKLAVDYNNVGFTELLLGEFSAAKVKLQTARTLLLQNPEQAGSRVAGVDVGLGNVAIGQGDLTLAHQLFGQAVAQGTELLGAKHRDILGWKRNVAIIAMLRGDIASADQVLQEIMPEIEQLNPAWFGKSLQVEMQLRLLQQRNAAAMTLGDRTLLITQGQGNLLPGGSIQALRALALARLGQTQETIEPLRLPLEALMANQDVSPLSRGDAAIYFAAALQLVGYEAQAQQWYVRGIAEFEPTMGAANAGIRAARWVPEFKPALVN